MNRIVQNVNKSREFSPKTKVSRMSTMDSRTAISSGKSKETTTTTVTTNLNRLVSYSDTNINYHADYKDIEEASGCSGLINLDGSLNLNMILKGIHAVILKENSLKLCELAMNILENLMNIDLMPSEEIDAKIEQVRTTLSLAQSSHMFLDDLEVKYNENFNLATDIALKNIKWLGCVNCQINTKTFLNEQLRGKIKLLLSRLHNRNPKRFRAFV